MTRTTSQGVTLVELLITLSLTAILLALAGPSFRDMMLNNRRAAQLNALTGSLNLARSAAVKSGSTAVVCVTPDCDTRATQWEDGWRVVVDSDKNGTVPSAGDQVLDTHEALASGFTLRSNTATPGRVAYDARGTSTNRTLTLCDSRREAHAKGIVILNTGRARLTSETDALTCPQ